MSIVFVHVYLDDATVSAIPSVRSLPCAAIGQMIPQNASPVASMGTDQSK